MGKRSQLQQSLHLYVWGRHPEDSALLVGCYHLPLCGVGLPHGWEGGPVPPVAVPLSADARDPLHGAVTAVVPVPIHHGEASSPSVTAPSPPDYHNKMWTMFSDSTASLRTLIIGHQNHIMFSRTCKGFCEMDWTKGLGSMLNLLQKKKKPKIVFETWLCETCCKGKPITKICPIVGLAKLFVQPVKRVNFFNTI